MFISFYHANLTHCNYFVSYRSIHNHSFYPIPLVRSIALFTDCAKWLLDGYLKKTSESVEFERLSRSVSVRKWRGSCKLLFRNFFHKSLPKQNKVNSSKK